jgi:signal transduction histidine kinase
MQKKIDNMKLQSIINKRYLLLVIVVFSLAGIVLFIVLGKVVDNNIDEILKSRAEKVKQNLIRLPEKEIATNSPDQSITIKTTTNIASFETFADTVIYEAWDKENVDYRKMVFNVNNNGKSYLVTIILSKLESGDMIAVIFYFMLGLFALLVLILFFLNKWLSLSIWKPFFNTLEKLKTLNIGEQLEIHFDATKVSEFGQLNDVLLEMVQKMQKDFSNLKDFAENASHELQTPVAIIKLKLEMALQDKSLSVERYHQIRTAYESASRLSKLNEALLLLSKIENRQFIEESDIDLCELTKQRLEFIEELIELKNVKVTVNFHDPFIVKINPYLAEILINNLLNNALKHNFEEGQIVISTSDNKITFSNTGKPLTVTPEKLFQRFARQNAGNESTGLGLAIASEICKNYKLSLQYNYDAGFHSIIMSVNPDHIRK